MYSFTAVKLLFTIFSILTFIYLIGKYANKVATAVNPIRYFIGVILLIVIIWGLYNFIGAKTGLYEPLSLDKWINPIMDKFTESLDRFFSWLFDKLHLSGFYEKLKEALSGW